MKKIYLALMYFTICSIAPHALATTYYSSESGFLSAAGSVAFDSFEDLSPFINQAVESIQRSGYSVSSSIFNPPIPQGDSYGLYSYNFPSGFGAFATDGSHYLVHQTAVDESLVFNFTSPVQSFGLSFTDWESPTGSQGTLVFHSSLGDEFIVAMSPLSGSNQLFFGVTSNVAFTSVEFINTSPLEAYGIDGVYFSSAPVPVPGALVLMISALVSLTGWRRLVGRNSWQYAKWS